MLATAEVLAQREESKRAEEAAFQAAHDEAFRRARVWLPPETPIDRANLKDNPEGPDFLAPDKTVSCRFQPGGVSGSTPKFDCELDNGDTVKVKYGLDNAELYTEVVATRLLAALGFPADRMYLVDRVRCYGCPADPFVGLQCVNEGNTVETCFPQLDLEKYTEFDAAVIERPMKGRRIETTRHRGWDWEELGKIDPAAGGAPRAHVDALRLMAIFLNHWDNKAKNQRLICLGEKDPPGRQLTPEPCERPVAMIQDLGGTFGPDKLDLRRWSESPVWADSQSCLVSMRALPYEGSTFPDTRISEEGRKFLAARLAMLTTKQIRELFEGARVSQYPLGDGSVDRWVSAFQNRVRAITDRAPCPA
jgi:hypothetical protein